MASRDSRRPLRIALISTPRAGNNWLRHLLIGMYGIPSFPVHGAQEVDWFALPGECLIAIHWHPSRAFLERLRKHGFQMVVLARHPLDVLISILHFALHFSSSQATQRWLEGEGGNERGIFAAMPRSTAFLEYASGRRAAALLAISQEWWHLPGCAQVRYEELLQDPKATLARLAEELQTAPRTAIAQAVAGSSLARLRQTTGATTHFWLGQSGLWRKLLTETEATAIARAHRAVFADLDYEVDPDLSLTPAEADANWINLIWEELAEDLHEVKQARESKAGLPGLQAQLSESRQAHAELVERFTAVQNQLLATQVTYQDMLAKFTAGQQVVGEMRARCALAEQQAEELRKSETSLRARLAAAEESCEDLREQLLLPPEAQCFHMEEEPRSEKKTPQSAGLKGKLRRMGKRYAPLASLAKWVSRT